MTDPFRSATRCSPCWRAPVRARRRATRRSPSSSVVAGLAADEVTLRRLLRQSPACAPRPT
ncbi:MAG: hypothetical protein R2692_03820 [Microbacterium sp.]